MTALRPLNQVSAQDVGRNGKDVQSDGFLKLEGLTKHYGDSVAVNSLDVSVRQGELVAFLGPSGCGKTTTLRMIAGFIEATDGAIYIDGRRVDELPSRKRGAAMVFQDYALFPHMTVFDNVAFGLRMDKVPKSDRRRRVEEVLELVQLRGIAEKYPSELSGGMRQRVALARAIVVEPRILLLDEPLSNLDAKLRKQLRVELRELHERIGVTTVFVTHDIEEAFFLADRIVVMNGGKLEQFARPVDIYTAPASPFVADFVGHTNMVKGELHPRSDGRADFHGEEFQVVTDASAETPEVGLYTIPPHMVRLSPESQKPDRDNVFRGMVHLTAYLGSSHSVLVDAAGRRLEVHVQAGSIDEQALEVGAAVWLSWDAAEGTYVAGQ